MKKLILLLLATGCSALNLPAQQIERTGRIEPVRYEKRDGKLKILSYVKLSGLPDKKISLRLNGNPLAVEAHPAPDSLVVWLPMIGKHDVLSLWDGRKMLADKTVQAPIDDDWGYFAQGGTIHIIQSSHQDIAWMDTPEYCRRERIEEIITPALDIMREDPDFTFEMEQTLNLMEFLEAHPERRDEVIARYKEGRFLWGATYNQPYEGLSSGEQLVRQAYFGRKWIRENLPGCDDRTANNIDVPGRTMQMPQILAKSGIKNLFVSRMREGLYDWYSPDGSKVMTYTPGNYGWASLIWKFFEKDAVTAFERLHPRSRLWSDYFRRHNLPPHYAVLMSCDATKPVNFGPVIDEWNRIVEMAEVPLPRLCSSTAERYFETVVTPDSRLEQVMGERPDLWLYIHGPAHYEQTVAKREAAVTLPAAEAFTTISGVLDGSWEYPRARFDRAWMASIYPDHGLGGKNGDTTDAIFGDSLAAAQRLGRELLDKAIGQIAEQVAADAGDIVVFNDLTWERDGVALCPLDTGPVAISTPGGKRLSSQRVVREGREYAAFIARAVPSMGYASYRVRPLHRETAPAPPAQVVQGSNHYRNAFYDIVLGDGGIVSLYDRELGRELVENEKFAFGDILDAGYKGNGAGEFNRIADLEVADQTRIGSQPASWSVAETGPVFTTFENVVPTSYTKVIQRVTIYHDIKRIDFDVVLENFTGEHNRQYRILFPLRMKTAASRIHYEVPMGVAEVGVSEMKSIPGGWSWGGTYVHHPADSHPREIQNFLSASGNGYGVTMSSCVAVGDWIDPSREQADYPVLQGVLLSSHKSCHGEGNWYHQAGTHAFRFSLLGHPEGWTNGYCFGVEANHPLRVVEKRAEGGGAPLRQALLSLSDPLVAVTAFKKADNDRAVILRLAEMEGRDKEVEITLPFAVRRIVRTDLIEQDQEPVDGEGERLTLRLGHHAIETYKLYL